MTSLEKQVPLIWTTEGNLPIADLEAKNEWSFIRDQADPSIVREIHHVEEYFLNGKSVKRAVAICKPQLGVETATEAATIG